MRILVGLALVTALTPTALAYPTCASVMELPPNPTNVYVLADASTGVELWVEWNDAPGLQRQACERADGTIAPEDLPIADVAP